jgi:hypothetical protein
VPVGKSKPAWACFRGTAAPRGRHLNRPVTIRWNTANRSSSISQTIRFPMRRSPRTDFPSSAETGGSYVRSSDGERMRTFSSGWPTISGASVSR